MTERAGAAVKEPDSAAEWVSEMTEETRSLPERFDATDKEHGWTIEETRKMAEELNLMTKPLPKNFNDKLSPADIKLGWEDTGKKYLIFVYIFIARCWCFWKKIIMEWKWQNLFLSDSV